MRKAGILLWAAAVGAATAVTPPVHIAVVLDAKIELSRSALEAMKSEFTAIFSLGEVRWSWHRLGEQISSNRLVVVRIWPESNSSPTASLAFTHLSEGTILPFVEFDPARVRRMLEPSLRLLEPDEGDDLLGRSLGRILAHEAYHVLANTTSHGNGVTKKAFCIRDLLADRLELDARAIALLEAGLGLAHPATGYSAATRNAISWSPGRM